MPAARFSMRHAARRRRGGVALPPAVPGAAATGFAIVPALQYHIPAGSAVASQTIAAQPAAVQAATSVSDMRGLADAANALGTGPIVMTDALGRRFLRFTNAAGGGTSGDGPNGPNLLQIGAGFGAARRSVAVFMVGRVHKSGAQTFFSLGTAGTARPNTGGGVLRAVLTGRGGSTIMSGAGNRPATGASANVAALYPGSQLQVLGTSSRGAAGTGANQGQRLSINLMGGNVDRSTAGLSGTGATIGSYAFTPDTGCFDLYELAVFTGELTDAQHDAIAAAMVANWAIPALTDQLVLEGDSITAGIFDATSAAGAVFDMGRLSGRNIVAVQIGHNDWTGSAASGMTSYNAIVALLNTPATGYLQRNWEVVQAINIATAASVEAANDVQRAALRAEQFLTDTLFGVGQIYQGKVARLELALIAPGGVQVFRDAAVGASDAAVYQGSSKTCPTRNGGGPLIATGGDTPQHGYGAIL